MTETPKIIRPIALTVQIFAGSNFCWDFFGERQGQELDFLGINFRKWNVFCYYFHHYFTPFGATWVRFRDVLGKIRFRGN